MKKTFIILACAAMMLSSCGTYTGSGAYTGGSLGALIGSAIGGITGGPRGADLGTLVGMAGGAAVGAAIGAQADQKDRDEVHAHYQRVQENKARGYNPYATADTNAQPAAVDYSSAPSYHVDDFEVQVDTTNSGDDRIEFE